MNSIKEVQNSDLCCGCGCCTNIYPELVMKYNKDGNLRPICNNKSIELLKESDIYSRSCPAINTYELDQLECKNTHEIWGSYYDLVTGYSTNEVIRYSGSSGGSITAILTYLIENKVIDGVIHVGVSDTDPLKNEIKISRTSKELIINAGSRYSPSAPLEKILEKLETGESFAFVGKPCDVLGLRNYSKVNPVIKSKIKYMIAFFCAGVPSIEGTYKILNIHGVDKDNVESFRYRGEGWPGYTRIVTKSNNEYRMTYDDSWGKVLNRHLPKRCKLCPDGIGEAADLVCGDAWFGDENGYPVFEEQEGRSLIISRTCNGQELLNKIVNANYLDISDNIKIEQLKLIQPFQFSRKATLKYRLLAMKLCRKDISNYDIKNLNMASKNVSPKEKLKTFLGTLKRVLNNRL